MDSHILSEGKEFDKSSSSSVTENEDSEPLIASLPGVAMFELPLSNQDGEDISSSDLVVTELQEDGEQEKPQQAADPIEGMGPKDAIDYFIFFILLQICHLLLFLHQILSQQMRSLLSIPLKMMINI